jgi:hypothetical protein
LQGENQMFSEERDGRTRVHRSLVFHRVVGPADGEEASPKDEERRTEVRTALVLCDGDSQLVTTHVLAHALVHSRLDKEPDIAAKATETDIDKMIARNRRRMTKRGRKRRKNGGFPRGHFCGHSENGGFLRDSGKSGMKFANPDFAMSAVADTCGHFSGHFENFRKRLNSAAYRGETLVCGHFSGHTADIVRTCGHTLPPPYRGVGVRSLSGRYLHWRLEWGFS